MKNRLLYLSLLVMGFGCSKISSNNGSTIVWDGKVVAHLPVGVSKSVTKRVFAHILPWFENIPTNGTWGYHWKMSNQNPNLILSNGQRQIASWYYPMIGPYASGDTSVIDYQLLLMKLSGIDGVFIDWPGTVSYNDLPENLSSCNIIISRLAKVGLKYAIVYEDNNLQYSSNKIATAQADMSYMQTNYFSDTSYEKVSNKPLLLVFGPQQIKNASDWTTVFSGLSTKPAFFTLQYQSSEAGSNATGEFTWVEQDTLTGLRDFYKNSYNPGTKIAAAFAGYNSFYAQGGGSGPTWVVTPSLSIFQQSVALALQQSGNYIQLVTWNDYGEGTMIEPTTQFQYSFLTTLQQQLGVQSLSLSDLQAVNKLYAARLNNTVASYNPTNLNELNQVYYDMVSLQMDSARGLLNNF